MGDCAASGSSSERVFCGEGNRGACDNGLVTPLATCSNGFDYLALLALNPGRHPLMCLEDRRLVVGKRGRGLRM